MAIKQSRLIMGMPVSLEILDEQAGERETEKVFDYLIQVDNRFSTYKPESEISQISSGRILPENYSAEMKEVFFLAEETKKETEGYFNIQTPEKKLDPSGLVKGWAVYKASLLGEQMGLKNFLLEAGGDMQAVSSGKKEWVVGIKNPLNLTEVVKTFKIKNQGVATSGQYIRGAHIYNPLNYKQVLDRILSVTVVHENVYEADRFATALFAMGEYGLDFARKKSLAALFITAEKKVIYTEEFKIYV